MLPELPHFLTSSGRRDRYLNTTFTKIQDIVHMWVQDQPRNNHPKKKNKKNMADKEQSALGAHLLQLTAHCVCSMSTYFCP